MDCPTEQFSTPCMTAAHINIHVCIHFIQSEPYTRNLWNLQVKTSWNGTFLRHPRAQMAPHYFLNPPTHTNSPYITVSPCISIHLDTLPKLNLSKLAGKTFSCAPHSQSSPKTIFSLPLLTLWKPPPTLIHTLRACSMLSLPSSYGYVLNHTRIYIETVILCPRLETLLPSLYQLLLSNLTTATNLLPNQTLSFLFEITSTWY